MKYFLFLLLTAGVINAQDFVIKSLKCYSGSEQTSFPVIVEGDDDFRSLTIEFDVKSDIIPSLNILFQFCNAEWEPYESLFFENRMYNTDYNIDFSTIPASASGARYHFKGTYPSEDVRFPFSGKYIYLIVDSNNEDVVYSWGKFYVVKPVIETTASLSTYRLEGEQAFPLNLNKTFELSASFQLNPDLHPSQVKFVEVVENLKIDYPYIVSRDKYNDLRFYEWNAADRFSFVARDIFPGNEYRQVDLRNHIKYKPPVTEAHFEGIETSRFWEDAIGDMEGGSILLKYSDYYAEYMDVVFKLRPTPEAAERDIFITGAFNDWLLLPEYRLRESDGLYSIPLNLKRGVYDYQYVTGEIKNGEIINPDWFILEGNYWDTSNDYHVFVYYRSLEKGGYDQIIGYSKINSGRL